MSHMTEHVGRVVGGRYRLLAPLGSGASAEVYLADDVRLRRRVAVKILHAALADDEPFLRRFRAEARAAASLSHPNILAIFDWNGEELPPYIVTEFLGGGSLRSILDAGQQLSPSQALLIGLQAAQALDHAHRQGFVHRDIKPANLLFGGEARLRIADFGLARAIAEAGWTEPSGAVLGTARYASPEQVRGEPLDGASDVYSLALVLIEAVTGTVPFSADTTVGTLLGRLDRPVPVPETLGALSTVLARAGQPDPKERPNATTLVNDLMDAATELPRPAPLSLVGATSDPHHDRSAPEDRTLHGGATVTVPAPPAPPNGSGAGPGAGGAPTVVGPTTVAPHLDGTAVMPRPQMPAPGAPPAGVSPGGFVLSRAAGRNDVRRWLVRGLAVVVALALGVAGAWFFLQSQVPSHEIPQSLIGAHRGDINGLVGEFGWRIKEREVYRDGTQDDIVLETSPEPGTKLREGQTLEVTISLGPTLVALPERDQLAGLSQEQVDGLLRGPGLELVPEFVPTPSRDVQDGNVIGYAEGTPDRVPKGSTVQVLVSSGLKIPDMEGWNPDDAEAELERLGLRVERKRGRSDEVADGLVIRTEPGAGSEPEHGDTVRLVVASGDAPVEVPDVIGMSVEEATEALEDEGLEVGQLRGFDDGEVWATDPDAGTEVDPGTKVDLWTF